MPGKLWGWLPKVPCPPQPWGSLTSSAPSSLPHSPRPQVWCPFPGHHRWRDLRRIVQGEADGRWKIMEGNFLCKNTERSKLKVHHLISFDFISFGVLLQLNKTRLKAWYGLACDQPLHLPWTPKSILQGYDPPPDRFPHPTLWFPGKYAAWSSSALGVIGNPEEGMQYRNWLLNSGPRKLKQQSGLRVPREWTSVQYILPSPYFDILQRPQTFEFLH